MSDKTNGNPNEDMFGSVDSFFDNLDDDVNGMVTRGDEVEEQATPTTEPVTETQSQESVSQPSEENHNIDWKKRYSDSTREAQKMQAELNELKPYVPVLEAMKKDSGLVEHVRGYFDDGGNVPKNIKEQLKLDEDFMFDADDMMNNPDSNSRKVFDSMVDNIVQKRANQILTNEKRANTEAQMKESLKQEALEFKNRHNMDVDEFKVFLDTAKKRFSEQGRLSFEDMYLLINRNSVNANVANATKEDMLAQMKNVRDIPTSQGGTNNAGDSKPSADDSVFDTLMDVDGNLDNMFG